MSSRALALVLTLVGAAVLFFRAPEEAATATGLLGAVLASAAWVGTLVLAVSASTIAVIASASGLAGAVIAVVRGGAWPGWSSRYARSDQIGEDEADNPRMMWESLDRGMDPTRRPDASTDD